MKILLVNPSQADVYFKANFYFRPLGLAYIAAFLEKEGHNVKMVDIDADRISEKQFHKIIKDNYELIGITATTPIFKRAENLFNLVKKNTGALTVLGGMHATVAPNECAYSKNIDFIVRGEAEITIVDLIDAIQGKKKYQEVNGISFKKNGEIIHTLDRELIKDIDKIPFPARHLFNQQKLTYPYSLLSPAVPIITSRGCSYNCTFCSTKLIFKNRVRFRSAKNVVDEIGELIKNYGIREIHIWDDNYTLNRERVFEIRDELKKRGIKLNFALANGLRVDQVDEEILRCLKDMGVYFVAFGVESGNQNILDDMKKKITLEQIEKAYFLAKKLSFETWAFFLLGFPGETEQSIRDTIKFAKKIDPDIAKFHILKPFPGTEVFDQLIQNKMITEFDYSKYSIHTRPVHRLPGLSEDDLLNWVKKAYREFYLRPSKILNLLLNMRSWERFKLNIKFAFYFLKFIIK